MLPALATPASRRPEEGPLAEYRIDDVARLAGTTVRSLRALHDRGLLPPPTVRGRTGYYDDAHLARARMVLSLQQQGFTLPAVEKLLAAWESGRDISQVLGLEEALTTPWATEVPVRTTIAELEARLGSRLSTDQVAWLVRLGLLAPDADGDYTMPAPALIEAGVQMMRAGIPLELTLQLSDRLRADVFAIADHLTRTVAEHLVSDETPDGLPAGDLHDLLATIAVLRKQAEVSIAGWFALGMDHALADYVGTLGDRVTERGGGPPEVSPRAT